MKGGDCSGEETGLPCARAEGEASPPAGQWRGTGRVLYHLCYISVNTSWGRLYDVNIIINVNSTYLRLSTQLSACNCHVSI